MNGTKTTNTTWWRAERLLTRHADNAAIIAGATQQRVAARKRADALAELERKAQVTKAARKESKHQARREFDEQELKMAARRDNEEDDKLFSSNEEEVIAPAEARKSNRR